MRGANPYYANEGRYAGIGQAVGNLGEAFLGATDPRNAIAADQAAWSARKNREGVIDTMAAREGRQNLGALFAEGEPGSFDPRQAYSQGIGSGALDPGDINTALQGYLANTGFDDATVARGLVGNGKAIGVNDAFSLEGQGNIAQRDQDYTLEKDAQQQAAVEQRYLQGKRVDAANKPLSRDQLMAQVFEEEGLEGAQDAYTALYGEKSSGGGGNPLVDAKRRADLEADVNQAITDSLSGMSEDYQNAPQEIYDMAIPMAMEMVEVQGMTPRAAVAEAMSSLGVSVEPDMPFVPFDSDEFLFNAQEPAADPAAGGLPMVVSDEDYDALPMGAQFQDENGQTYIKR